MKSDAYWHDVGDADQHADAALAIEQRRQESTEAILFAFADLESTACRCGARKNRRQAFCDRCLTKLPEETQRSLRGERERFPKAYFRAMHELGLLSTERLERGVAILDGRLPKQVE